MSRFQQFARVYRTASIYVVMPAIVSANIYNGVKSGRPCSRRQHHSGPIKRTPLSVTGDVVSSGLVGMIFAPLWGPVVVLAPIEYLYNYNSPDSERMTWRSWIDRLTVPFQSYEAKPSKEEDW
jgi:hypothetical protein